LEFKLALKGTSLACLQLLDEEFQTVEPLTQNGLTDKANNN